jgi:hypothetical protein
MNRDNLLDKIRALLSKTTENGCTEQEAMAALEKARAMMDAYEVTEADLQLTKAEAAVLRSEPAGSRDPHNIKWYLCSGVADFCDCKAWRSRKTGGLVFCGMLSDAQFATWLLDSLAGFVQGELVKHLMGNLAPKGERRFVINGFVMGCTARISSRLEELTRQSKAAAVGNSRALVVTKTAAIKSTMEKAGIKLRSGRASSRRIDGNSYRAGQSAGDRASFGRPVNGQAAALRLR